MNLRGAERTETWFGGVSCLECNGNQGKQRDRQKRISYKYCTHPAPLAIVSRRKTHSPRPRWLSAWWYVRASRHGDARCSRGCAAGRRLRRSFEGRERAKEWCSFQGKFVRGLHRQRCSRAAAGSADHGSCQGGEGKRGGGEGSLGVFASSVLSVFVTSYLVSRLSLSLCLVHRTRT